jgi:hypothetical protein
MLPRFNEKLDEVIQGVAANNESLQTRRVPLTVFIAWTWPLSIRRASVCSLTSKAPAACILVSVTTSRSHRELCARITVSGTVMVCWRTLVIRILSFRFTRIAVSGNCDEIASTFRRAQLANKLSIEAIRLYHRQLVEVLREH